MNLNCILRKCHRTSLSLSSLVGIREKVMECMSNVSKQRSFVRHSSKMFVPKSLQKTPYSTTTTTSSSPSDNSSKDLRRGKFQLIDNQYTVSYVEAPGNPDHVVLLIPGSLSTIDLDFLPLLEKMDRTKYKVISYDLLGFGDSRPPHRWQVGEGRTEAVEEMDALAGVQLMERLGHDKYSIMGWSLGGFIGSIIAVKYPERVRKLAVWGMGGYWDETSAQLNKVLTETGVNVIPEPRLGQLVALYGQEGLERMFKKWMDDWKASAPLLVKGGLCTTEGFHKIQCPMLIMVGDRDRITPLEQAQYINENVSTSRLLILPKGSHATHGPPTEKELIAAVDQFFSEKAHL